MKSGEQKNMCLRIEKMHEMKGLEYREYTHGCIRLSDMIMVVLMTKLSDPEKKINKMEIRTRVNAFFNTNYNLKQIEASLNKGKDGDTESGLKQKGYLEKNGSEYTRGGNFNKFYEDLSEKPVQRKDSINTKRKYIIDLIDLNNHEEQEKHNKESNEKKLAEERKVDENFYQKDPNIDVWLEDNGFGNYIGKFRDLNDIDDLADLCYIELDNLKEMGMSNHKISRYLEKKKELKEGLNPKNK